MKFLYHQNTHTHTNPHTHTHTHTHTHAHAHTHTIVSLVEKRNSRPINRYKTGRNLSSRKKIELIIIQF